MDITNQRDAPAQDRIQVKNPITGEIIGAVAQSSRQDVASAVERARAAQPTWEAWGVRERCRILRKWRNLLWKNQQEIARIIRQETGKTDMGAFSEVYGTDQAVNYYTSVAPRLLAPQDRTPIFPFIQRGKVYFRPYGVIGFITPWNYPVFLGMMDCVPALLAGNTMIIKPSEITPYSALYMVDLMHQAGVPAHVAQVVTGDGSAGAALVDLVDYVCFTGSTAVGRKVAVQAADRLIPYTLELGGKDAMIVLRDANIELAASQAVIGACENAGQACVSTERIYVEAPIYDHFVERVKHYARQVAVGSGDGTHIHMGSLTNERELLRVEEHIRDAVEKGAEVVFGGQRRPDLGPLFFEPTVLIQVDHSMKVMREETFGPLIPIMRVSNEEEAIQLANDSEYGLSALIFTTDLDHGERLAARLRTGDVSVNRAYLVMSSIRMPWGGRKHSGSGQRGGPEGLMRYVTTQAVAVDTQIGAWAAVSLVDSKMLALLKLLRIIRRFVRFI